MTGKGKDRGTGAAKGGRGVSAAVTAALAWLAAAACSAAPEATGPTAEVVDSAGVTLVTSRAPAWSERQAWRVRERPSLRIGELDGPLESTFGNVRAVGRLADGRVFVGDEQAHSIFVFSEDGEPLATVGGEGDGPGELQWFLEVAPYRGDSLWVYDYRQRAVSVFGPDLAFARRFPNPVISGNYWIVDALADGRFLMFSPGRTRGFEGGPGVVPDTSLVLLLSEDGSAVDTVGGFEVTVTPVDANGRSRAGFLVPRGGLVGAGDRIAWTEAQRYEIRMAGPDGVVDRIARREHEAAPVTDEVRAAFADVYVEWVGGSPENVPERTARMLREGYYADTVPALSYQLHIDPLGYLWAGRYAFPGATVDTWDVFDPEGVWQGTVGTPEGLEVRWIGVDEVMGVVKGEYDVPYVQAHRLDRRGAG